MKKSVVLLIAALCVFVFLLSACQPSEPPQDNYSSGDVSNTAQQTDSSTVGSSQENSSDTVSLPEYQPGSIKLEPLEEDDYDFDRKYRIAYYQINGELAELLNEEEYADYMVWVDEEAKKTEYGKTQNEMMLVSFVKRYDISRDEFGKAVKKYTDNRNEQGSDTTAEANEIPNGDIIYTFDNEIINRYYRYE